MPGSSPNNYAVVGVTTSGNGVYGQVATANQAGVVGRQLASSGNWAVFGFGNIRATAEPGNAARGPGKGTVAGLRERPPPSGGWRTAHRSASGGRTPAVLRLPA